MKKNKQMNSFQRWLSASLIAVIMTTLAPWADVIPAFAAITIGSIQIDSVDFAKEHNGLEMTSAYVQIIGSGLKGTSALFEKTVTDDPLPLGNGGFQAIGTKIDFGSDSLNDAVLKYTFTAKEAQSLTGKVLIGGKVLDLKLGNFPNLNKLSVKNVNVSKNDDLTLYGNNLDQIGSSGGVTTTATYGRDLKNNFSSSGSASELTLTDPTPASVYGYQDIEFTRSSTISVDGVNTAPASVRYTYAKAFRFTQDVGLTHLEMYPNLGSKGDYLYLTADTFPPANYQVYLMKKLDGTEEYSATNRATTVNLDSTKKQLVVQVPNTLSEGDYNVVLTKVEGGEVVAEQIVTDNSGTPTPAIYTVVDSLRRLSIEQISPTSGPDTGVDATVVAKNMINMNIPGLILADKNKHDIGSADGDTTLTVDYGSGTFNGKTATITRKISIFVGNKATFYPADVDVGSSDSPDKVAIRTASIDDVLTDPKKDVLIETETTITASDGKVYSFKQSATLKDAFTFVPSTLTPVIDKVTPDKIQVVSTTGSTYKLKQETLLVIKGSKFNVYKKVNADGSVELKKPSVFIKGVGNISESNYQVAFLPNDSGGIIKTKVADADVAETVVKDALGNNIKLQMTVLNNNNEVVDGTVGNDTGTKIVLRIPAEVTIKVPDVKKNIQVSNPRLGSDAFGNAIVKYDALEVITTSDYPIIEAVVPNVVSVDGGVDVVIRGTNFANGVKVYLDGEEVTGVTREVDTTGDKINLKFKAPAGRVGLTQLQVMNPSGGMAVWDFNYVKSFDKDPSITSFSPAKGIYGTLVSVNGDNFLKPDPTAPTNIGLDAFRLIGSKVYLDGADVNQYNQDANGNLQFIPYAIPNNEALIGKDGNGMTQYAQTYKNAYAYSYDPANPSDSSSYRLYYLERDEMKHPVLTDKDTHYYALRYNNTSGAYEAYGKTGALIDNAVTLSYDAATDDQTTFFTIHDPAGTVNIKAVMDNNIVRMDMNADGTLKVKAADYSRSLILQEQTVAGVYSFFTLSEDFEGNAKLSNGKDKVYKIIREGGAYYAVADSGAKVAVTLGYDSANQVNYLTLDGTIRLNFTTAYRVDASTKIITGNRTRVVSKNQILFTVPVLSSGTGYKDLAVVNPDTKRASKTGTSGFYYVSQAGSYPVITRIDPNEGSDEGGYNVTIYGKDFQDGVKVIVDAQTVPDADVFLALDGKSITFKMPKCLKDLKNDYGVDRFTVPVVVLNTDGASDSVEKGFTYIKPSSIPKITKIIADKGSANGNEIVEIFGTDFRFFEPFKDADNDGSSYEPGDVFTDLNGNGKWDNYLTYLQDSNTNPASKAELDKIKVPDTSNPYHTFHYESKVLPRVFFGTKEAKVVQFSNGYLKVITPAGTAGTVDLYVVNNDSGITNKVKYTYESSAPKLTSVIPNIGKKSGQELKELYGTDLYRTTMYGYYQLTDTTPVALPNVQANVKFAAVDNLSVARSAANSGLINNGTATINLTGGLKLTYTAEPSPILTLQVQENGKVYSRDFSYNNSDVLLPMGMLMSGANYYTPSGITKADPTSYNPTTDIYEYVRVRIVDRQVLVERGYAPRSTYDNTEHVTIMTPSYYTIDTVPITYTNPDGGKAKIDFTYTNPASVPKIYDVKPKVDNDDKSAFLVEGSVKGGWEFEIIGEDFREGAKVKINGKEVTVVEITKVTVTDATGTHTYDDVIVKAPAGTTTDIDKQYPIFIQNTDAGIANSTTLGDRIGPDAGKAIYFVYRKPLSAPVVKSVSPKETSAAGGNTITLTGTDFRAGAKVIVGTQNGVPMPNVVVSDQGTKITFTTTADMPLGTKSVTVQNSDYGSGTLENAITVISAPTVSGTVYNEAGTTVVTRASVEGGETITIKGTGFVDGTKVYFGPKPTLISGTPTGTYGLYKDDKYYDLSKDTAAASVTYVDSTTLRVKTPEILTEGTLYITALNPDKGISNSPTLLYSVPIPSDVNTLNVDVVAKKYIRLYDYQANNADYYEIYYYIGDKTANEIRTNSYKDFIYLTNTDSTSYRISRLPGYEKLQDKQYIHFVVKAVNKFGATTYSNVATLRYDDLKDVKELGQGDIDGPIGVPEGKTHVINTSGNQSIIQLSAKLPDQDLTISFTPAQMKNLIQRVVNVPSTVVNGGTGLYSIYYGDSTVRFQAKNLNTEVFRDMSFDGAVYGQMFTGPQNNALGSTLKASLPRGYKAVGNVYSVAAYGVSNTEKRKADVFTGSVDFGISYAGLGLTNAQESAIKMYYHDPKGNTWTAVQTSVDKTNDVSYGKITKCGEYVLLMKK